jgi:hypothetical protein
MDLRDRHELTRETHRGFGDALAQAFELALTPAIFGAAGWLLDRWLGTWPVFALTLFLFTFGYVIWKHLRGYSTAMQDHADKLGITPRRPYREARR